MYLAQNYDVPKVDEPEKIFEKVQKLFSDAKKEVEEAKKKWTHHTSSKKASPLISIETMRWERESNYFVFPINIPLIYLK